MISNRIDERLLTQVIALGDDNRRTLGFLPRAGFRAAAGKGTVLVVLDYANGGADVHGASVGAHNGQVAAALTEETAARAVDDGETNVVAYCLYDLPRDIVRLTHLCIAETHRGLGLARALIEDVSQRHADRLGIRLKCRPDWPADKMWPSLGFAPRAQVVGRSKQGHPLTVWWRSHGHADLMSLLIEETPGQRVAIDTNIFSDLHSAITRPTAVYSAALAPLIAEQEIRLVVPHTVRTELYRTNDVEERRRFLAALENYEVIDVDAQAASQTRDRLIAAVPTAEVARDPSLHDDALLVAEAALDGVDIVVTSDANAVDQLAGPAADLLDTTVVGPTEVATVLDIADAADDYRPVNLQETAFEVVRVAPADWTWATLSTFLNRPDGETKAELNAVIRDLAMRATDDCRRSLLLSPERVPQAAWVTSVVDAKMTVHLLRVAAGPMRTTLARQLAFHLRVEARGGGASVAVVADLNMGRDMRTTLLADGFTESDGGLQAHVLDVCGPWREVLDRARRNGWTASAGSDRLATETPGAGRPAGAYSVADVHAPDRPGSSAESGSSGHGTVPSAAAIAELERTLWPAKLLGAELPTYFVPIVGAHAALLLGYPPSLMRRDPALGLSREQVYYRSWRGQPAAPARILWYGSRYPQEIIGTSRLIEAIVAPPVPMHQRFSRLGVYSRADVHDAATNNKVGVIRFADTEVFRHPVSLERYREAVAPGQDRRRVPLRSVTRVDDDVFAHIYRDGMRA